MHKPLIWTVGDTEHREFTGVNQWLAANARVEVAEDATGFPAAIVLFQSRPGMISQDQVEALHRRAPLARLIAVVGSLCEGEPRSGRIWNGVTRLYWHQALARLPIELGLAGSGSASNWRPRTQNETDVLLARVSPGLRQPLRSGLIAICSPRRSEYQALADACWAFGWRSCWQSPAQPPQFHGASLLLIDGWQALPTELSAPTVLLLDFPRTEDAARADELGIRRVLARPLLLTDLLATLGELTCRHAAAA